LSQKLSNGCSNNSTHIYISCYVYSLPHVYLFFCYMPCIYLEWARGTFFFPFHLLFFRYFLSFLDMWAHHCFQCLCDFCLV